jgi:hypothetical protein
MSSLAFEKAGLLHKKSKDLKRVKIGIYSISRLIKILEHVNSGEFTLVFNYDVLVDGDTSEFVGTTISVKNINLRMTVECTPLSIFKYIPDDLFKTRIAASDNDNWILFTQEEISDILSLCNLDSDYKFMDFSIKDGKFIVSGKTFNKLVEEGIDKTQTHSIAMHKEQFEKLDVENYTISIGDDRIVCIAKDSQTTTVLSAVQKDDTEEKKDEAPF